MKKTICLVILIVCYSAHIWADDYDEPEPVYLDTIVQIEGYKLRVEYIPQKKFEKLYEKRDKKLDFSKPIEDIKEVEKLLGSDYKLVYSQTDLAEYHEEYKPGEHIDTWLGELRYKDSLRILICECEGFQAYYPKEKIIVYWAGHTSDVGVNIATGGDAYNPYYSAQSAKGKYMLWGLFSGQEHVYYNWMEYDKKAGKYKELFSFSELFFEQLYSLYAISKQFFEGDKLYFRTGWGDEYQVSYQTRGYVAVSIVK